MTGVQTKCIDLDENPGLQIAACTRPAHPWLLCPHRTSRSAPSPDLSGHETKEGNEAHVLHAARLLLATDCTDTFARDPSIAAGTLDRWLTTLDLSVFSLRPGRPFTHFPLSMKAHGHYWNEGDMWPQNVGLLYIDGTGVLFSITLDASRHALQLDMSSVVDLTLLNFAETLSAAITANVCDRLQRMHSTEGRARRREDTQALSDPGLEIWDHILHPYCIWDIDAVSTEDSLGALAIPSVHFTTQTSLFKGKYLP